MSRGEASIKVNQTNKNENENVKRRFTQAGDDAKGRNYAASTMLMANVLVDLFLMGKKICRRKLCGVRGSPPWPTAATTLCEANF